MPYTPTSWVDGVTPVDSTNMNKVETGISDAVAQDEVTVLATRILANKLLLADANPSFQILGSGKHDWGAGGASVVDANLYRLAADTLKTDDQFVADGGLTTKTTAGTPSDADTATDVDGSIIMDTTNSRLYVRSSGAWIYVPLAAADPTSVPSGVIHQYGGLTAPSGYLLCDGAATNRSTYASLYAALVRTKGTITVTIATPGVVSLTTHGLQIGDAVFFSTTGALPTGITADTTTYYIIAAGFGANSFQISTSRGGSAVNTSGSQSGVHTMWHAPYGVSGSTTFNVPDLRGRVPVGFATTGGHADVAALALSDSVTLANRRPTHRHTITDPGHTHNITARRDANPNNSTNAAGNAINQDTFATTSNTTGITVGTATDQDHAPAYVVVNHIIKT